MTAHLAQGAVEMHRTDLVRPVLDMWGRLHPDSSVRWAMAGWMPEVDGRPDLALEHVRRTLALDPGNEDAAAALRRWAAGP